MRNEEFLVMTTEELDRTKVIEQVIERRLTAVDAAQQLGLTSRHVGRLVKAYRENGTQGLLSKQRGKRSNRAFAEPFKQQVLSIVHDSYADFGPQRLPLKSCLNGMILRCPERRFRIDSSKSFDLKVLVRWKLGMNSSLDI